MIHKVNNHNFLKDLCILNAAVLILGVGILYLITAGT